MLSIKYMYTFCTPECTFIFVHTVSQSSMSVSIKSLCIFESIRIDQAYSKITDAYDLQQLGFSRYPLSINGSMTQSLTPLIADTYLSTIIHSFDFVMGDLIHE